MIVSLFGFFGTLSHILSLESAGCEEGPWTLLLHCCCSSL